jgi:predicted O-linked N-acetylglucosamine transferase (SPINDLY family)
MSGPLPPAAQQAAAWRAQAEGLLRQGRLSEAEAPLRRALELAPEDVASMANLAALLQLANRFAEAEPLHRRALALEPGNAGALRNLGTLLKERGDWEEAKACFTAAAGKDASLSASLQAHLALSPIVRSEADIARQRAAYAEGLEALDGDPRAFAWRGERIDLPWYYLPYHGVSNRELMAGTGAVLARKVAGLAYRSPRLGDWRPPAGRRLRVAFATEHFHAHTIGHLNRGFVERLDRGRFEVGLFHSPYGRRDAFRDALDGLADRAEVLAREPAAHRAQIEAFAPDVLFFPEIGMSGFIYGLAHARLAPVQAATWGHPMTSGIPEMDYFVSSDLMERPGAEADYMERLVRLPNVNTCYAPPPAPEALPGRRDLGLPEDGALYGCPQTLFKLHPAFDQVLGDIARADPTGRIVLLAFDRPDWVAALKARWAVSQPILLERVLFLPKLSREAFVPLLAQVDVLLDPLHFGSGNSFFEAMLFGTPTVTSPGPFACSRIAAATYRQMQVADAPVAERPEGLAPLAVALATDPARNLRLREELRQAARARLFGNAGAVTDLERFLEAAVAAAAAGDRLPSGWPQ